MSSALYAGDVVHVRLRPRRHSLRYRVFCLLLDLDDMPRTWLFARNAPAVLSFWDRDHGDRGPRLRGWIDAQLAKAGLSADRVEVLCYPRMFGYAFNPLTEFFCYRGGVLVAILHEVHNTFGEARTYVIPAAAGAPLVRQQAKKELFVSPFMPMDCTYDFTIRPPAARVLVKIDESDAEGLLLHASFSGRRRPLTDAVLLRALLSHPLMTLKVTAAIHWEALKLFLKGVKLVRCDPAPERVAASVVAHHAAGDPELQPAGQGRQ